MAVGRNTSTCIKSGVGEVVVPPGDTIHVFGGGEGIWGVGMSKLWCLNHVPCSQSAIRGVSDPSWSSSLKTPNRCFSLSFSFFLLHFEVITATFGHQERAVGSGLVLVGTEMAGLFPMPRGFGGA